jgi:hypothetical protein
MTQMDDPSEPADHDALWALRRRALPPGAVDGLYEEVRRRTPPSGAPISLAFLDAPRALAVWRTAALAASLVLALGVGAMATGVLTAAPPGEDAPPAARRPRAVRAEEAPLVDARPGLMIPAVRPDGDARPRTNPHFFVPRRGPDVLPVSGSHWD